MSEKYKVKDSTMPTFITLTLVGWVDVNYKNKIGVGYSLQTSTRRGKRSTCKPYQL